MLFHLVITGLCYSTSMHRMSDQGACKHAMLLCIHAPTGSAGLASTVQKPARKLNWLGQLRQKHEQKQAAAYQRHRSETETTHGEAHCWSSCQICHVFRRASAVHYSQRLRCNQIANVADCSRGHLMHLNLPGHGLAKETLVLQSAI